MGERRPLASLFHGFLGALPPWCWDPWGRQKCVFGGWKFVGGEVLAELGFLPLYNFSDFRNPLLGFHHIGPLGRVRPLIGLFPG